MRGLVPRCAAACTLLAVQTAAQTIVATNWTSTADSGDNDTLLTISHDQSMVPLAPVLPFTAQASNDIPPIGLAGQIYRADPTNQLGLNSDLVAFISCDASDYPGNIDPADVFGTAASKNASAILFYSQKADYCAFNQTSDQGGYPWIFSMKHRQDTQSLLEAMDQNGQSPYVEINMPTMRDANGNNTSQNGTGGGSQQQQNNNPLGPSPSTAVAMIILYSITGVITALFLVIIITGAVRAHRHPERYGPRTVLGMPRQSRARGLGRAILDTIPIVKFGEREQAKDTDVELANNTDGTGAREVQDAAGAHSTADRTAVNGPQDDTAQPRPSNVEEGIAAATPAVDRAAAQSEPQPGCSICTEDFEVGQDQRVLPCDHRFHPECVDPWLLNVSSTCPLCRVDLRPQTSRTSAEVDEHGNPIAADGADEVDGLPPPLGVGTDDNRRSSVRQSLRQSILGIGRPDRMTREERVLALRQYRRQQAVRRRQSTEGAEVGEPSTPAPEAAPRNRLSRLFAPRPRQTSEGAQAQHESREAHARENIDFSDASQR